MARRHIVDTHALVWYLEGNPRIGPKAKGVLDDPTSDLVVPLIALAEACWIVEHGKTSIQSVQDLLSAVDVDPRIIVFPLERAVLDKTIGMKAISEMHDRQIVATALCLADAGETIAVITKDDDIRKSGLVPIVW